MLHSNAFGNPSTSNTSNFYTLWSQIKSRAVFWKQLFVYVVLSAFVYIFMEWLFFVTMPSFMSLMGLGTKIEIFLVSGCEFSLLCTTVIAGYILVDILALLAKASDLTYYCGLAIPTIIVSALILLLVDNFTYTIFKFGISTSTGIFRGVYGVLFILLIVYVYRRIMHTFKLPVSEARSYQGWNIWFYSSLGLLVITTCLALFNLNYDNFIQGNEGQEGSQTSRSPNIILLGSDGLNANHLSVYGYDRDTTPRLNELAKSSLVAENAFTNAGNSEGSVVAIMTSKLPTQTRVLYPPDILTGINSYQHLPGILKNLGYQSIEYGVPYYIDAFNYNLQNGFDLVNSRIIPANNFFILSQRLGLENEGYFLTRLIWRISDRILHIFFIREMQNPYKMVTQPVPDIKDEIKISQALALLDHTQQPLFIHIHLLGTHGGLYDPEVHVYSKGERQSQEWMADFYDDTLLGFDAFVGEVVDHLEANGQFDNTLLIIYTDHNQEFKSDERVPLIIHFPGGENAGVILQNVENLDIAPTILDYLGVTKPTWMDGESLLKADPGEVRLIFSMGTSKIKPNEQELELVDPGLNKPPFYQFSYITVLDCQRMYTLDLTSYRWSSKDVPGYVQPCKLQELLDAQQIHQAVYQRLAQDGFDISSLP